MIDPTDAIHRHDPTKGGPTVYDAVPRSERQLAFAEDLARRAGVALPAAAVWNRGICGAFIARYAPRRRA